MIAGPVLELAEAVLPGGLMRLEIGCALGRAAAQLSEAQRDVFVLAEFHDLDTRAIASVLGIRESTVKTRLFRARERLRELLRGVWEER